MRVGFVISFLAVLAFASCEDKKKPTVDANLPTKELTQDSSISEEIKKPKDTVKAPTYPVLSNENVVEFLTQYGKENPETKVLVSTQHGDIFIELYKDTPIHRANFIYLVKQKYFDGTFFHRVVPNFIIQGGNSDNVTTPRKRNKIGKKYLLPAELNNGRIHKYGTVSGAKEYRENPDKRTAPYEFFIFLGPKSSTGHLNGNYTIFGRVTQGMDIVEKIANLEADSGDWPLQNVYITAEVIE
ncbi:MAG: peptidylprolyl isomerase [Flavobacteriaceae bacterium]|nr:peptidylprolyl isomerase [Flavobacteriaceae bacterium]